MIENDNKVNNENGGIHTATFEDLEVHHKRARLGSTISCLLQSSRFSVIDLNASRKKANPIEGTCQRNNSSLSAAWNISNLIQGIGILGIPYAVSAGSWTSFFVVIFVAMLCCYTGQLLIECLYVNNHTRKDEEEVFLPRSVERLRTYGEIGKYVFPRFGNILITTVCNIEMFGALILYIILLGSCSHKLLKYVDQNVQISQNILTIILAYMSLPLLFGKSLKIISIFSFLAVCGLSTTTFGSIIYAFSQIHRVNSSNMPTFHLCDMPLSIGIIIFSYCAHAIFPSVEESMKKPQQYPLVLKTCFTVAAILKIVLGFIIVFLYGADVDQNFIENISRDNVSSMVSPILMAAIILNVFFSIPLVIMVVTSSIDQIFKKRLSFERFGRKRIGKFLYNLLTRTMLITAALIIAIGIPHFGLIMAFIGSLTGSSLCFIFPVVFHLILFKESNIPKLIVKGIIICIGIYSAISGMLISGVQIYKTF